MSHLDRSADRRPFHAVEPLEPRAMLALTGPHAITVRVFNDLNRDGLRNSNEPGLPDWGVIAYELRDGAGTLYRGAGRTGADGTLARSEERRVGKEGRARWSRYQY